MNRLVLAVVLSLIGAHTADARCGLAEVMKTALVSQYGEAKAATGMVGQHQLMELWANPRSGSWTVMLTSPQGVSCVVAMGNEFEAVSGVKKSEAPYIDH